MITDDLLEQRVVAFDIHPQRFGFVVLEGPLGLLDWGARSFRGGVNGVHVPMVPKIARILDHYMPEVVLFRASQVERIAAAFREVTIEARQRGIEVHLVSSSSVAHTFAGRNANKHEIALAVTEQFPELGSLLPTKRKPWQSEHYRTTIFDALALSLAYFNRQTEADLPQAA